MSHEGGNPFGERPREQQRRPLTEEEDRIIYRMTEYGQLPKKDIDPEFVAHPEFQESLKQAVFAALGNNKLESLNELVTRFHLESWLQSPEGQQEAKSYVEYNLPTGRVDDSLWIIEYFKLPKSVVEKVTKESLVKSFDEAEIYHDSVKIAQGFSFDEAFLQGDAVAPRVKKILLEELQFANSPEGLQELIETFHVTKNVLQSKEVQDMARKGILTRISVGDLKGAQHVMKTFGIDKTSLLADQVREAAESGIAELIMRQYDDAGAKRLADEFGVPKKILDTLKAERKF